MIVSLCVHPECRVNCGCWWWEHCFVTWLEWQQRTPDLGQHISTDWKHVTLARIGYMKPTMHPNTGVQQWRNDSWPQCKWHEKLNQEYTLVTMDLAAAKIAYNLIWGDQEHFAKAVVNLGPFHTMCWYLNALGKRMSGSGFEDIVVEAGLCASSSIEQVMSGKLYNRSMRMHQRMLDALERMLMTSFQQHAQLTADSDSLPTEPSPGTYRQQKTVQPARISWHTSTTSRKQYGTETSEKLRISGSNIATAFGHHWRFSKLWKKTTSICSSSPWWKCANCCSVWLIDWAWFYVCANTI